jgi:hypothetical protein
MLLLLLSVWCIGVVLPVNLQVCGGQAGCGWVRGWRGGGGSEEGTAGSLASRLV